MTLTQGQLDALRYALDELVERYQDRHAPPVEHLERIANEAIQTFTARARARGATVEYVRVSVSHDGLGNFAMTPIIAPLMHSITIAAEVSNG